MKKLSDKIISLVCCIAMVLITCFGVSYKVAHKTYADATPTTKQTIGMWFSSLLASMGARLYITTAQGYEWLVDNFNEVMRMANLTYTLGELVEDAQQRYNEQSSTLTLPELPSKAISIFLENLWNNGFRQDSVNYDVGYYSEGELNYYIPLTPMNVVIRKDYPNSIVRFQVDNEDMRVCYFHCTHWYSNGIYFGIAMPQTSTGAKTYRYYNPYAGSWTQGTLSTIKNGYYINSAVLANDGNIKELLVDYCFETPYTSTSDNKDQIISHTFGENSSSYQEIQVYGDGTIGLDDMVNTADRDKDVEIDYNDLLGAEAGAKTFAEVMEKIRAILEGEQEGAIPQAEVIVKTITPVPNDVPIPLIFEGLPEIVKPECETLGACLVSGVQTASQHLQNIYNSNSSVANYTMVSLAIGVALYILTGGI